MNIEDTNLPSFNDQLAAHKPYLREQIATFLVNADLLEYVQSVNMADKRPKKSLSPTELQDRLRDEADGLEAWTDAAKAVNRGFVSRAVATVEQAESENYDNDTTRSSLGAIILKHTEDVDIFDQESADAAVDWVHGLFADPKHLKAYNRLFAKDQAKKTPTPSTESTVQEKPKTHTPRGVTITNNPSIIITTPEEDISALAAAQNHKVTSTINQISDRLEQEREERRFVTKLDRWVRDQVSGEPVKSTELVGRLVELLKDVDEDTAQNMVDNITANTERVLSVGLEGSRVFASKSWVDARAEQSAGNEVVEEPKYVPELTLEDSTTVKAILEEVVVKSQMNQGVDSSKILQKLKSSGIVFDKKKLNTIIREICNASNGDLSFEKRGKTARAKLYFDNPDAKASFRENPDDYTAEILFSVLIDGEEQ